jgi:hypothetical protein
LLECLGGRLLRPFGRELLHRDSIAASRADDVGAIGQDLLAGLEHQLLPRPEDLPPDAVRDVSLSADRQAFYPKLTRIETGIVCGDHRIALDGLAHLAAGVHAAVHDGVAEVRPGLIAESASGSGGWGDDGILCTRPSWIRLRGLRQPESNPGGTHADHQDSDDSADYSRADQTPRSATTSRRGDGRHGR